MTQTEQQIAALAAQGVSLKDAEAFLGRAFTPDEQAKFRRAKTARRLKRAVEAKAKAKAARESAQEAAAPKSTAERVREHVARQNEVGEIPKVKHPRLKARCRYDLEAFGWYYCRELLRHRASAAIKEGLIADAQNCILSGGKSVKLYGRGAGKTTWLCYIAPLWALLYGHRRFPVLIAATLKQAKKSLKTIKKHLVKSDAILADFPAVALPLRKLAGIAQRAAAQTYFGALTDAEWGSDQITLPMLRQKVPGSLLPGEPLDPGCGAILACVGIGGAIRGANEGGQRPDFLIIDDPQTRKAAHSPATVQSIIDYIHQDALFLAGHNRSMSAFVTITPQCFGDVATELSSQSKHPEWAVTVEPFIRRLPTGWEGLTLQYCEEYQEDMAAHDYTLSRSRAWYASHREDFDGMEVLDPEQYDPKAELDAIHHLLNMRASLGEQAFNAEIMMQVSDAATELELTPDLVASALNGSPKNILPPGTDSAVAFCDVNIKKGAGMSWAIVAFGPGRVAAVVNYGRFPPGGVPLVQPNQSELARNRAIASAIRAVAEIIAQQKLRDQKGRAVPIRALAFDRGWLPDVVHRTLFVLRKRVPFPFPLVAMRGYAWNKFGTKKKDMLRRGDHVFATRSQYGEYLAEMAPFWREVMQSGFLETPLMPGSLSLYGSNASIHRELAQEVCNEKLVRKYLTSGGETAWDFANTGPEHFCDALTGCFALASWYRCYDKLSQAVDPAALRIKTSAPTSADLFDPRQNEALADGAEAGRTYPPKNRPSEPLCAHTPTPTPAGKLAGTIPAPRRAGRYITKNGKLYRVKR